MPLLSLDGLSVAFGLDNVLDNASLRIDAGERICLIGRNGAGKSTLLKIIAGELPPDEGEVRRKPALRHARLSQELPGNDSATVFETVASGLGDLGCLVAEYHRTAAGLSEQTSADSLRLMERLQHELETRDGWRLNQRVENILTRLQLPADTRLMKLSGGWRRRVELGRALVNDPELLLLDEPTNHLDIEAIQWLEEQLLAFQGGLLFVTHDRTLLQRLATRIVELDRGRLTSWPGDYAHFLQKKAAALEVEARHQQQFDKKLAQEEVWIRQGIKARRTRNEGRARALRALREERRRRRERTGTASFSLSHGESSGKLVIEAAGVGYRWDQTPLIEGFSTRILRGDRIGLIGPNGSGKTTLLQILLGRLPPHSGAVRLGTKLQVAYFDQLRAQLDPEQSVIDNVAGGRESIDLNGKPRHIISYLSDFLFTPQRARSPVKSLSGGERNRLLLARLFSQPANLLVMDEPTNDLDMETLELLEERLIDFQGTLLLVSHDRAFLDNVVTGCFVFEGAGRVREYVGGYSDWVRQRKPREIKPDKSEPKGTTPSAAKPRAPTKLSYKDQRELAQLPQQIENLEREQSELHEKISNPAFFRGDPEAITQTTERLKTLEEELAATYERWEALEAFSGS